MYLGIPVTCWSLYCVSRETCDLLESLSEQMNLFYSSNLATVILQVIFNTPSLHIYTETRFVISWILSNMKKKISLDQVIMNFKAT